jgi:hypothetical protein
LHVGPEAIADATQLHGVNNQQAFSVDWIHAIGGFLLLLSSFGTNFYATREKILMLKTNRRDITCGRFMVREGGCYEYKAGLVHVMK